MKPVGISYVFVYLFMFSFISLDTLDTSPKSNRSKIEIEYWKFYKS